MEEFKSGFVSLIGKTNSGKSTLLNRLVKEKVAITTPKTQTTRTAIKAIINNENSQIIITDTPGIHKGKSKLSNTMIDTAMTMVGEVDCVLFLVDCNEKSVSVENTKIIEKLKTIKTPVILVINKTDLVPKEKVLNKIKEYSNMYDFKAVVPISALKDNNIDVLVSQIEKELPVRA